jgi:hypothetical protein
MTDRIHAVAMGTFAPMLRSLSKNLAKGAEHAKSQGKDPDTLVDARLAPDMFSLAQQVKLSCHHAVEAVALLTGKEHLPYGDADTTLEGCRERIAHTVATLDRVTPADLEGASDRHVQRPLMEGRRLEATGLEYVLVWSLPHVYFHVVTAYDILRHVGVPVGKRDFVQDLSRWVTKLPS